MTALDCSMSCHFCECGYSFSAGCAASCSCLRQGQVAAGMQQQQLLLLGRAMYAGQQQQQQ